jgi:uncharacterized membrane protein YeaQ/YmgE (transglycosylase-associated protein family)
MALPLQRKRPDGCEEVTDVATILVGIAGAVLGGVAGRAIGLDAEGEPAGFLMALFGAVVLLELYRTLARPRQIPPA